MAKVMAINPRGQVSIRPRLPQARRLDTLDDKTVYIVDVRWPYTREFVVALHSTLTQRFTRARFVLREKAGSYGEADPRLWAEIQEQADAAIVAVGH